MVESNNGICKIRNVEVVEVFEGKVEDEKVVRADVQLKAKETGITFTFTYTLVIKELN